MCNTSHIFLIDLKKQQLCLKIDAIIGYNFESRWGKDRPTERGVSFGGP
jgi:hypothetical protein